MYANHADLVKEAMDRVRESACSSICVCVCEWLLCDAERTTVVPHVRPQMHGFLVDDERKKLHKAARTDVCYQGKRASVNGMQVHWHKPGDHPTGMTWRAIGAVKPEKGRELTNETLASQLAKKTDLTEVEWESCEFDELNDDDFILVGQTYYQPVRSQSYEPYEYTDAKVLKSERDPKPEWADFPW
eukprot:5053344-Prymnesium_polylepis.2